MRYSQGDGDTMTTVGGGRGGSVEEGEGDGLGVELGEGLGIGAVVREEYID